MGTCNFSSPADFSWRLRDFGQMVLYGHPDHSLRFVLSRYAWLPCFTRLKAQSANERSAWLQAHRFAIPRRLSLIRGRASRPCVPCPAAQTGSAGASPSRLLLTPADQRDWLTPSRFELHPLMPPKVDKVVMGGVRCRIPLGAWHIAESKTSRPQPDREEKEK
jgi:hypothetical protein